MEAWRGHTCVDDDVVTTHHLLVVVSSRVFDLRCACATDCGLLPADKCLFRFEASRRGRIYYSMTRIPSGMASPGAFSALTSEW
jgi:hypothetical protein